MKSLARIIALFVTLFSFAPVAWSASSTVLTIGTNGNGSVARNPDSPAYPMGATVTLTATPAPGWVFSSWSGDASGAVNPLNVSMDTNKSIAANFSVIPSYTLTVNTSGSGSVTPPGGSYLSNNLVQLTATPDAGHIFHHWNGDATGNANPLDLTMNGPKLVMAVFIEPVHITAQPADVTVVPGGSTNFSVSAAGTGPLSYQWRFNNNALPGATQAALALTNIQPANGGLYSVVASNPYGSVTSAVALLIVNCPGTNVVSTPTDAALRAAIQTGGNVRLCFSGTVTLTNTIIVDKDTTLDASGVAVTISGGGVLRLFDVQTNITFGLTNLLLTQGHATGAFGGAAMLSRGGAVILNSCRVNQNSGRDVDGGALACLGGSLSVRGSEFVGNVVNGSLAASVHKSVQGGAIHAQAASVQIFDSLFLSNSLASDSTITGGEFTAQLNGGALSLGPGATALLVRTRFLTNTLAGGYTRNGTIPGVGGGAIYNRSAELRMNDCSLLGNQVQAGGGSTGAGGGNGGALANSSTAHLNGCVFVGNSSVGGDGRITGPNNGYPGSSARGGAVDNGGFLFVTNCTFTANSAKGGSAGSQINPAGNASGGAMHSGGGSVMLVNVTVASNLANVPKPFGTDGLSLGMNVGAESNYPITLRNSLLAGASSNAWGAIVDGGYNFSSDGTANFASGTSFNFTDPKLLSLADQGGPTLTMALAPSSPAIDWAPLADAPATDQRGLARPVGPAVDAGAFEYNDPVPPLLVSRDGAALRLAFYATAGSGYRLERSNNFVVWELHELIGPFATNTPVTRLISPSTPAQYFRLKLNF